MRRTAQANAKVRLKLKEIKKPQTATTTPSKYKDRSKYKADGTKK